MNHSESQFPCLEKMNNNAYDFVNSSETKQSGESEMIGSQETLPGERGDLKALLETFQFG